jgi:hypothetical protein
MHATDLSTAPDSALVSNVKKLSCSESFSELSRRHSSLFYKICNNYIKILTSLGATESEVFEERDHVLYKAILNYDPNHPSKTRFSTHLGNCTRYFCLHKIKKVNQMPKINDEDALKHEFEAKALKEYEARQPKVNLSGILNKLSRIPDKRIPSIFKRRYDPTLSKKKTWRAIAGELDLSIQNVQALHKKGIQLLKKEISKNNVEVFL